VCEVCLVLYILPFFYLYVFICVAFYIVFLGGGVLGSFQWKAHCCGVLRRLVRSVPGIGSGGLQS
jgi:hypothetical protein